MIIHNKIFDGDSEYFLLSVCDNILAIKNMC